MPGFGNSLVGRICKCIGTWEHDVKTFNLLGETTITGNWLGLCREIEAGSVLELVELADGFPVVILAKLVFEFFVVFTVGVEFERMRVAVVDHDYVPFLTLERVCGAYAERTGVVRRDGALFLLLAAALAQGRAVGLLFELHALFARLLATLGRLALEHDLDVVGALDHDLDALWVEDFLEPGLDLVAVLEVRDRVEMDEFVLAALAPDRLERIFDEHIVEAGGVAGELRAMLLRSSSSGSDDARARARARARTPSVAAALVQLPTVRDCALAIRVKAASRGICRGGRGCARSRRGHRRRFDDNRVQRRRVQPHLARQRVKR